MTEALAAGACQLLEAQQLPDLLALAATDPQAWSASLWQASLEQDQIFGWLLPDGRLVACLVLGWGYREAEVLYLLVAPEFRRQQLASRLLQEAQQRASAGQAERLLLEVRASNLPAIQLYERQGFKIEGRRKNYYASSTASAGKEDAILMSLDCRLERPGL